MTNVILSKFPKENLVKYMQETKSLKEKNIEINTENVKSNGTNILHFCSSIEELTLPSS